MFYQPWLVLVPPLIVLIITLLFRHVILSLACGILSATIIIQQGSLIGALTFAGTSILAEGGTLDHLYTFWFLFVLGVIIQILYASGGIYAYTQRLLQVVTSRQGAERTSLTLSTLLCVDDYLSNLTVGAIMQPITDHFKLPRAKLAFLLDSMSGPLCLLVPLTSWVAFILGQLQVAGISDNPQDLPVILYDPLFAYISCIPFLLYPLSIVFTAWVIVTQQFSFGGMARQEQVARKTGNLFGGKTPIATPHQTAVSTATIWNFLLPIGLFLLSFIVLISYSGNATWLGGSNSFLTVLQQADSFWSLFYASVIATVVSIAWNALSNPSFLYRLPELTLDGFYLMKNSLIVLLLAWTFSSLLKNNLHTGTYLASLLPVNLPVTVLPGIMFIFSLLITASTGSVWGTIALMLPITIPLYVQLTGDTQSAVNLFSILGSIFSGAVAGSHFSPITDATVMASTAAGSYHLDHVRTHIAYAWPALLGSFLGYLSLVLIAYPSFLTAALGSIAISLGITYSILYFLNNKYKFNL